MSRLIVIGIVLVLVLATGVFIGVEYHAQMQQVEEYQQWCEDSEGELVYGEASSGGFGNSVEIGVCEFSDGNTTTFNEWREEHVYPED